jgi:hypothetical protein
VWPPDNGACVGVRIGARLGDAVVGRVVGLDVGTADGLEDAGEREGLEVVGACVCPSGNGDCEGTAEGFPVVGVELVGARVLDST